MSAVTVEHQDQIQRVRVHCRNASALPGTVLEALRDETRVGAISVREPSLEDAYVSLLEEWRDHG